MAQGIFADLTGRVFGKLTVMSRAGHSGKQITYLCQCACGGSRTTTGRSLSVGDCKSCGCMQDAYLYDRLTVHGQYGTVRYHLFRNAKKRSSRDGIPFSLTIDDIPEVPKVCPVLGFEMVANLGGNGSRFNSPTLDRIRPDLGYIPSNIQIISQRANSIKTNATPEEIQKVAAYMLHLTSPLEVR